MAATQARDFRIKRDAPQPTQNGNPFEVPAAPKGFDKRYTFSEASQVTGLSEDTLKKASRVEGGALGSGVYQEAYIGGRQPVTFITGLALSQYLEERATSGSARAPRPAGVKKYVVRLSTEQHAALEALFNREPQDSTPEINVLVGVTLETLTKPKAAKSEDEPVGTDSPPSGAQGSASATSANTDGSEPAPLTTAHEGDQLIDVFGAPATVETVG